GGEGLRRLAVVRDGAGAPVGPVVRVVVVVVRRPARVVDDVLVVVAGVGRVRLVVVRAVVVPVGRRRPAGVVLPRAVAACLGRCRRRQQEDDRPGGGFQDVHGFLPLGFTFPARSAADRPPPLRSPR